MPMEPGVTSTQPEPARSDRQRPQPAIRLRLDNPFVNRDWPGQGFVGAWVPDRSLVVSGDHLADARHGPNWFLLAATDPITGERVHHDPTSDIAVAFVGYVVDPPLHQRSPSPAITDYWRQRRERCVNGHFCAAVIDPRSESLTLRTDAFGFMPLYYRVTFGAVLFATSADLLVTPATRADDTALLGLLNGGSAPGDRTLFEGIHRVPLGGCLTFSRDLHAPAARRFDLEVAGSGTQAPTRARMDAIDALFRQAVDRCLALDYGRPVLALSGGLDSRRVLAKLLAAGERPTAVTVRVLQKGNRDLDAPCAQRIAHACGLEHELVELPDPGGYARDNELRRQVLGAETHQHAWVISLHRSLPGDVAIVFNGFLGDSVDESKPAWENMFVDPGRDIECFVEMLSTSPFARLLSPPMDERAEDLANVVRDYLAPYAELRYAGDLAHIVLRGRRATALNTQFFYPRNLEAKPFIDLDYLRAVLDIDPRAKTNPQFRRNLLADYHPELANFRSSADYNARVNGAPTNPQTRRDQAYVTHISRDLPWSVQHQRMRTLLSPRGRALATLTRLAPAAARRWYWAIGPLFEAALHRERTPVVWRCRD